MTLGFVLIWGSPKWVFAMLDDWYYAQNNERRGPVSIARLKAMAADGWLGRDDLVWRQGMVDWVPARDAEGLFANPLGRMLQKTIAGLRRPAEKPVSEGLRNATPPSIPVKTAEPAGRKARAKAPKIELSELSPRHLIAACGGFLAALGIAFTAVAQSRVALAFTLSGLFITAVGLYVEIGKLLSQAIENIGKASKEAAERRLRAKELALEKQRLDVEAARLAQEQAARMAPPVPAAVLANQQAELLPTGPAGTGQLVVINHPPVQRWSPPPSQLGRGGAGNKRQSGGRAGAGGSITSSRMISFTISLQTYAYDNKF